MELIINGIKTEVSVDEDFVRKLIKKSAIQKMQALPAKRGYDGYQVNTPVKVCVVGKDILGIKFGDFLHIPIILTELPIELTPTDKQLKIKMKLNNILLILGLIACIPGAFVILFYLVQLLE